MPEVRTCPKCGTELPADAPSPLCPRCSPSSGLEAAGPVEEVGPHGTKVFPLPANEQPGERIDRYKLLQEIDTGAFGVVYVAEQEKPVKRRVALKIIKLGMDTKEVIARFEAERQALALMDHPNIAKVFDAGATQSGRPYFAMELVKGERITQYCDKNNLTTRERLDLFVQICHAIQHAHQKGIIHRDIKPSNILVAMQDGAPVPKVIDFGISKATQQRLTEKTAFTAMGDFIGTPDYMSPEQAEMTGLDIDTRSDIYSLGALLYELLTGKTPFDLRGRVAKGIGIEEIRRIIREEEPQRPSARLAAMDGEELTATAARRRTDAPKLVQRVRGDLDWIVMKCLEKDRTRRYDTANGVAMDVRRHLENQPVLARPPSTTYRLQKAFRRHRLVFAAAAAIAGALVLGVIGTTLGLLRAQTQALAARRAAYISDVNLAEQALAANNLRRARTLLNRQRPQPGQRDLRDWEWRYLWSQTRADDHEIFLAGTNRLLWPLSFSADGRLLARETESGMVVTDLNSRRAILQRPNAMRPVFAHHGVRLAFVARSTTNDTIVLLDLAAEKESRIGTSWTSTRWIGFTPDDLRLLTVSSRPGDKATEEVSYDLTAWDVDTGRQLWQRGIDVPSTGNGRPYAISPDGGAFAGVLPHGRVQVLETQDGRERFATKTTEDSAMVVMFSPDSSTLLTGAAYADSTIRLWNARNGTASGSLEGHHSWVSDLIFTADGKRLISSSGDRTIRLWDWPTLKPAGALRGHLDEVDGLTLAPDGRTLASRCKDGSIYLWDVTKPTRHLGYQTFSSRLQYSNAVFTPDSQSILAAEVKGGVAQWDARTLQETRRLRGDSTNEMDTLISPDARWVLQHGAVGRLRVWDAHSGLESTNFMAARGRFGAWMTGHGKFLVTLYGPAANALLEVRDTDTWQRKGSLTTHADGLFTTSLPNLCVILTDQALRLLDVTKLEEAPKEIKTRGDVLDFAASPDGRMLAAAYEDESVLLWDATTLQPLDTVQGSLLAATSVAFSPDGRRLAVGSEGAEAVKLWDAETRQEVLTLSGEGSGFAGLKFSPDGRYLLAINEAGLAHLWSAPTWAEIEAAEADERREAQR